MSQLAIRAALETRLSLMAPAIATSWENKSFTPPASVAGEEQPWQKVHVLFARPESREQGGGYNEIGYMQVTLMYPLGKGTGAANARANAVRDWFPKKSSLVASGVVTTIIEPPEIGNGKPDGDRWSLPVRIPFMAQIFN